MRGASFMGAYSLVAVKVVLSDPKYLAGCQSRCIRAGIPDRCKVPGSERPRANPDYVRNLDNT